MKHLMKSQKKNQQIKNAKKININQDKTRTQGLN